ncbi:Scr1 family TA system antitoxin-like transcriptional regulator [Streptomyces sp. NPDC004609]|uniref:helix-turn-helix domain-containing protein n=1 Tax=Streptomyces sp. NPDC004609 TaxID=3364704 RepID=UPI0036C18246
MVARSRELTPDRSARDLFGSEMRRLRTAAGMSLERLADVLKYSKSSLARFETAESMIPPDLPAKLDAAFGTDLFEKLYSLARKEIHPDQYRRRMELEARARVIAEYLGHVVPGLLQTEDYARALFRAHMPEASPDTIQDLVTARLSRQDLLRGARPPHYSAILDEAVLRRPVGGPAVMRAQLAALLPLVDSPTTMIQVLPFEHGEHSLLGGTLTLLTLENRSAVAYEESIATGTLFEDPEKVGARERAYELMRASALSPRETTALIRSTMEALPA